MAWNGYPLGRAFGVITQASNVSASQNPAYTQADFRADFDQFDQNVPGHIIDNFIAMADATVKESRWFENWRYGMGLFVAHFCTLYMQARGEALNPTASQVISTATTRGLITSKSVGDVSVSYDINKSLEGLEGWGQWTTTTYGAQFAQFAKMLGKAGIYVW